MPQEIALRQATLLLLNRIDIGPIRSINGSTVDNFKFFGVLARARGHLLGQSKMA